MSRNIQLMTAYSEISKYGNINLYSRTNLLQMKVYRPISFFKKVQGPRHEFTTKK
jgi:hypothetical protein